MKIVPISHLEQGEKSKATLVVIRDNQFTATVCCWDFANIVRANSLKVRIQDVSGFRIQADD
jgi:hypothetical protein